MELTELLNLAQQGDTDAAGRALEALGNELRRLAGGMMQGRTGHTLQPTALINEAYLRVAGGDREWVSRGHFLSFAAQAMRSVLVDHARRGKASKRGGAWRRQPLTPAVAWYEENQIDLLALDAAMERLGAESPRELQVVELRFFAGLNNVTVAEVLGVSVSTVERDWAVARAWLHRYMTETSSASE